MPFSALSPEGPISLLGVDAATLENLRSRNRKEGCFTAKCCGSPVVIRTAEGKSPHFVHKVVPAGCDGDRGETPEHRRLKELIADCAERTYEWDVETEAVFRGDDGSVVWRADVLATKSKASVAFEVQLSNADFEAMRQRQARYKESSVRGLWFVRTKKGFPAGHEVPIFPVESDNHGDWVVMETRWDSPDIWRNVSGDRIDLKEFVEAALNGQLKWAPFETRPETVVNASIVYEHAGKCSGCGRMAVRHRSVRARVATEEGYPEFIFHGSREHRRRSEWYMPIVNAVWGEVRAAVTKTLRSVEGTCCWCRAPLDLTKGSGEYKSGTLNAQLRLGDLPKAKFGTVERDWLRRWTVLGL